MEPRRLARAALNGLVGLAAALGSGRAAAADAAKGGMPSIEIASDVEAGEARPAAPDQRTRHLYLGVSAGVTGVAGSVEANVGSMTVAGTGFTFGGLLGIGITRYATFQIFGDRTLYAGPAVCSDRCSGSGFTAGFGLTYHIAQALAFDPWGSFGVAYRQSLFHVVDPESADGARLTRRYNGIDVARIAFGGDWFPSPFFGFGPFVEGDFGTNFASPAPLQVLPPNVSPGPRAYAIFQLGVRVSFDPLRRASAAPGQAAKRTSFPSSIGLAAPSFGGATPGF